MSIKKCYEKTKFMFEYKMKKANFLERKQLSKQGLLSLFFKQKIVSITVYATNYVSDCRNKNCYFF